MKSITRLLLVVITAALLVACQSKEADATLEPSPFEWIPSSQDGVELTMSTDTIDSDVDTLTFTIRNGGDEAIQFDSYYTVEKEIDGAWFVVPFREGVAFQDDAPSLAPSEQLDYVIPIDSFESDLTEGTYRIVKTAKLVDSEEDFVVAVPFSV